MYICIYVYIAIILLLLMPRGLSIKLIEYNYIIICIYICILTSNLP